MPKISVIMSVYNGVRFLDRAIQSILSQTEKDFEFIIIDDASIEPVYEKIKSYSDSRIKVYREEENKGLTVRLNQCLQLAKGNFIARFDADDVSLPYRFEKQLSKFEEGVGFVGCWARSLDETGRFIEHFVDTNCRCSDEDLRIKYSKAPCMVDASVIYSREAVDKVGFYDPKVFNGESYNYTRRVQQFFEGRVVQEILYLRTIRYDSIMRMIKEKNSNIDKADRIDIVALANQRANTHPIIKEII